MKMGLAAGHEAKEKVIRDNDAMQRNLVELKCESREEGYQPAEGSLETR
jgi:hypothetical protein